MVRAGALRIHATQAVDAPPARATWPAAGDFGAQPSWLVPLQRERPDGSWSHKKSPQLPRRDALSMTPAGDCAPWDEGPAVTAKSPTTVTVPDS